MTQENQDPNLKDFLHRVWHSGWWVCGGALVGCGLAFVLVALLQPQYRAKMIVSPANPINGAESSSLLADDNLFALRYVMQRVGSGSSSDFVRFENSFAGVPVAAALLKREDVRRGLAQDRAASFLPVDTLWSPEKFAVYIQKRVKVDPVGATALRSMSYYHPNAEFAAKFLGLLHVTTDQMIRQNIREKTEERVQYLKKAIQETYNPEHKRALTTLLMEQERLRMLVSIENDYSAEVVEPASSSYKPVWPDRALIYVLLIVAGMFGGFLIAGTRYERFTP